MRNRRWGIGKGGGNRRDRMNGKKHGKIEKILGIRKIGILHLL